MKCRADGRCAYPYLKAIFNIGKENVTVTLGGKPVDDTATIDWGDGTEIKQIPISTENSLSHTYQDKGTYTILLTGEKAESRNYDVVLKVCSDSTPRIQEMHILTGHFWADYVERSVCEE